MVSETSKWKCDICNIIYDDLQTATDCEASHYPVSDLRFQVARWDDFQPWPKGFKIRHQPTGETKSYKLVD